jgi:hypothetical protein
LGGEYGYADTPYLEKKALLQVLQIPPEDRFYVLLIKGRGSCLESGGLCDRGETGIRPVHFWRAVSFPANGRAFDFGWRKTVAVR